LKTIVNAPTYNQVVKNKRNSLILSLIVDLLFIAATIYFIYDGTMTTEFLIIIISLLVLNIGFLLFNQLYLTKSMIQYVEITDEGIEAYSRLGLIKKYAWKEIDSIRKDEIRYVSNGFSHPVIAVFNGEETKPLHLYNHKEKPIVMSLNDQAIEAIDEQLKVNKIKLRIE